MSLENYYGKNSEKEIVRSRTMIFALTLLYKLYDYYSCFKPRVKVIINSVENLNFFIKEKDNFGKY